MKLEPDNETQHRHAYLICQLLGWFILYAAIGFSAWLRPIFTPVEWLYALVLVGSSAIGSHFIRSGYKKHMRRRIIWQQVIYLGICSLFFAAIAGTILLSMVFMLAHFGVTNPIPSSQQLLVAKLVFTGNFFNMLLALLFWSVLYFSISKVRQLRQTSKLLKSSQLDALKNQLNPHFLFNAINNIRALILEDPGGAREMLARLADMLRYSLSKDDKSKVTLSAELAIVNEYIALCSIQFEERLRFSVNAPVRCQQALVPKLLLQLCVENAIKHGISTEVAGGSIDVTVSCSDTMLHIIISNDGKLDLNVKRPGVGLQNIRQRLTLLYPDCRDTGLALQSEHNKVKTHIRLPLEF
ncbi:MULTISPECIES: sensor histidine kinase [unclassified Arsukibacterium]|uniref:sensor histidine kinase n=1 Tax=unclassified Arsukibacterium TaxID=2635278 RepID=UPI000C44580A|nr:MULTISPECIES: histidine kinase [unclassified Arsukibacterium]MAA95969.1 transcriptional regulator [Rheinheimera sp.]MBM33441.1 transcriptional regulator [Rheinheimera sp.]|tara:strand:+ start:19159 stop:20220 length:1062 start_codon:yes stop_codon:yes gene_type:complete